MQTKISGIYIIHNSKNGKVYLGQAQDLNRRWTVHRANLRHDRHGNKHLQSAWNKYGENHFSFKILEYCPVTELDNREQHYLNIYIPKGICYNIAKDATAPMRGRGAEVSLETRQKLRESTTGRKFGPRSDETKRKLSEARRKRPPMSKESREKLSKSLTGKKRKPFTEDTRHRMSQSAKAKSPPSAETRRKLSEATTKAWEKLKAEQKDNA